MKAGILLVIVFQLHDSKRMFWFGFEQSLVVSDDHFNDPGSIKYGLCHSISKATESIAFLILGFIVIVSKLN